jgi:hypothetical protein
LLENLWEGNLADGEGIGRVRTEVVKDANSGGVLSGQECGPVWRAYGSGGIGMGEPEALLGQLVKVRGLVKGVSITTELRPPQVVGENEYDVGWALFGKGWHSEGAKGEQV